MNVGQMLDALEGLRPTMEIEVAPSPNKDEWYEVFDVEITTNGNGKEVVVINTD